MRFKPFTVYQLGLQLAWPKMRSWDLVIVLDGSKTMQNHEATLKNHGTKHDHENTLKNHGTNHNSEKP